MEPPGNRIPLPDHFPKDDESEPDTIMEEDEKDLSERLPDANKSPTIQKVGQHENDKQDEQLKRGLRRKPVDLESKVGATHHPNEEVGQISSVQEPGATAVVGENHSMPGSSNDGKGLRRKNPHFKKESKSRQPQRLDSDQLQQSAISSTSSKWQRGLQRTPDELNAKLASTANKSAVVQDNAALRQRPPKTMKGLRRTLDQSQPKNTSRALPNDTENNNNNNNNTASDEPLEEHNNDHDPEEPARIYGPENTITREQSLVQARLVAEESFLNPQNLTQAQFVDLEVAEEQMRKHRDSRRKQATVCLAIVALCLLGIVLGLIFGLQPEASDRESELVSFPTISPTESLSPSLAPSNAPSTLAFQFHQSLPNFTKNSLEVPDSPQANAFDFVINHPEFETMDQPRRIQLYSLATFYYSFGGPSWPLGINENWLNPEINECNWFSSLFGTVKVDDEGQGEFVYVEQIDGYTQIFSDICQGSPCIDGEFECLIFASIAGGLLEDSDMLPLIPAEMSLLTSLYFVSFDGNGIDAELSQIVTPALLNVQWLSLAGNRNITGTLPSYIGDFQNLLALVLYDNQISGTLPTEIGLLTSLIRLGINNNQFSGTIPTELGLLSNLHTLRLDGNNFRGTLPTEILRLTNLFELSLDGSILEDDANLFFESLSNTTIRIEGIDAPNSSIPFALLSQTNLIELDLSFQQLIGTLPTELGMLTSLVLLHLQGNQLSGTIPSQLGLLTRLNVLYLQANMLTGTIPSELGKLSLLTIINLSYNSFSGSLPPQLMVQQNCSSDEFQLSDSGACYPFHQFILNHNLLSGSIPSHIGLLRKTTNINLWQNALSGTIPTELGNLENLSLLWLDSNQLTGTIPSELGSFNGYPNLLISGTPTVFLGFSDNLLTGTVPLELGLSVANNYLVKLWISGNDLSGTLPDSLCYLQDPECHYFSVDDIYTFTPSRFPCHFSFNCTDTLCGCNCSCL